MSHVKNKKKLVRTHTHTHTRLTALFLGLPRFLLPISFLQAGCPPCRPTNSVKALKAELDRIKYSKKHYDNTDECILKTSLYVVLKNKSS